MQQLKVTGNVNFRLEEQRPLYRSIMVSGDLQSLDPESTRLNWTVDEMIQQTFSLREFTAICNEIKGCEYEAMPKLLQEHKIRVTNNNIQELDLIKSLANIYLWVESFFIEEYDIENSPFLPKIYDEFIVDINNKPTSQRDIYFLPRKLQDVLFQKQIQNLQDINLLKTLYLKTAKSEFTSYFIPFIKLGYNPSIFQDDSTFEYWTNILNARHKCLDKFFNKR